jgi:hypothetical protein
MVRKPIAVLLVVAMLCSGAAAATPEGSLELGLRAFRAGDFASAVIDLEAAAQPLAPSELLTYVETAQLDRLPSFETALVYLALAQFRLGREDDARQTILQLIAADRLGSAYATLPLQADAAEFETLVAALVPASTLPHNLQIAANDQLLPLPAVTPVADQASAVTPAEQRAVRDVAVREYIARQNEFLQRTAAAEIEVAQLPPAPEPEPEPEPTMSAPPRVDPPTLTAPSLVAVERQADERVAEAQEDAARRIAAAEAEARKRVAAAEARVAEMQQPTVVTRVAGGDSAEVRAALGELRQAEALAENGEFGAANEIYLKLVASAPREIVVVAAVGLYRDGAYRESIDAFRRLGAFARGEEDLHYYYAVSLYEAGQYEAARKELACALPFIQVTDEVARYRLKIEQSTAQLSASILPSP